MRTISPKRKIHKTLISTLILAKVKFKFQKLQIMSISIIEEKGKVKTTEKSNIKKTTRRSESPILTTSRK